MTSELTIRDLLVHRSGLGLGAGDLLWWPPSNYDRREIARRLQFIPLKTSFRSAYAYDNVLYLVAGEVIEAVSGQRWEEFVETRILKKIGMTASNVRHSAATAPNANVATTHGEIEGKVRPIAPFDSDNTNPAGGINSNAEEMAKWMIVQLDSGRLADGSRLFSRNTTRELWSIVTPEPLPNYPPELATLRMNFRGYALGFEVRDYRGQELVTHTGGLPGYVSKVALLPALKMGVVILTNQESGSAFESIAYKVLDDYLNAPPHDWLAAYQTLKARSDAQTAAAEKETQTTRNAASNSSLPLSTYAGTYTDAWYGDIVITHSNGKLGIRSPTRPRLSATSNPGSTIPSWPAGMTASCGPMPS